jgi:hypothetical protein
MVDEEIIKEMFRGIDIKIWKRPDLYQVPGHIGGERVVYAVVALAPDQNTHLQVCDVVFYIKPEVALYLLHNLNGNIYKYRFELADPEFFKQAREIIVRTGIGGHVSHTATVDVEFKDIKVLEEVCKQMKGVTINTTKNQKVKLFSETVTCDLSIKLPGWNYPIAIKNGKAYFDNYNGHWGKMTEFEKVIQQYAKGVVLKKVKSLGYYGIKETVDSEGNIELEMMR